MDRKAYGRESYTGVVVPRFWDESRHLPLDVRALAVHLVTGRHNEGVPGCAVVGMGALADELNVTPKHLAELWAKLEKGMPGFVEYDHARRLLRVRSVPKIGHRPNQNVLRAWWRHWRALPESPLKYAHLDSLREALPSEPSDIVQQAWSDTFGSVSLKGAATDEMANSITPSSAGAASGAVTDDAASETISVATHGPIGGTTDRGRGQCSLVLPAATQTGDACIPRAHTKPKWHAPAPQKPLPFTIAELLAELASGSNGLVATEPYDTRITPAITLVIRQCARADPQVTLADVRTAGEFIAARWNSGHEIGPRWVSTTGNLLDLVAKARKWDAAGRQERQGAKSHSEDAQERYADSLLNKPGRV